MVNNLQHCCYIGNINTEGQNEQNMMCILWCVLLLKFEGPVVHYLEMCHFPRESAGCEQASKNQNNAFSVVTYCPIVRT